MILDVHDTRIIEAEQLRDNN